MMKSTNKKKKINNLINLPIKSKRYAFVTEINQLQDRTFTRNRYQSFSSLYVNNYLITENNGSMKLRISCQMLHQIIGQRPLKAVRERFYIFIMLGNFYLIME